MILKTLKIQFKLKNKLLMKVIILKILNIIKIQIQLQQFAITT